MFPSASKGHDILHLSIFHIHFISFSVSLRVAEKGCYFQIQAGLTLHGTVQTGNQMHIDTVGSEDTGLMCVGFHNLVPTVQSYGCMYVSIPLYCTGLPTYAPDLPHAEHQEICRSVDPPVHSFYRHFSEVHRLPGLCGDYIKPQPLRSSLVGEGLKAAFHIQKPFANQRTN